MNKNQKGFGILELFVAVVVLLLIAGAGLHFLKSSTRVTIENSGESFSFDLGVPAKAVTLTSQGETREYFRAIPKDISTAVVATINKQNSSVTDIRNTCIYNKFDVVVLGQSHTVCDHKHIAYVSNFDTNNNWYTVVVFPEDLKSELNQADVSRLIESIKSD